MKKNISKIALRTDKIVSLSKSQINDIKGGLPETRPSSECTKFKNCFPA